MQSGYSRQAETEADQFAAQVLSQSNIDTRPLAGFFERIIKQRKVKLEQGKKNSEKKEKNSKPAKVDTTDKADGRSLMEWISSHPATNKRIEFFNKSKISTTPEILNQTEWQALQKICGPKKEKQKEKKKDKAPI